MFAVAGVSGRTGAATAEALLKQGQKVRVLVRKAEQGEPWLRRHAEVAVTDFTDVDSLTKALTGMTGASLLLPPQPDAPDLLAAQDALIKTLATAVKKSGLKRLAFLSSAGAQHPAGTGPIVALNRAEKALSHVPSVTFVRAAYFLENWVPLFLPALESGELPFFGHVHLKFPQVCAHDVGVAAADALVQEHKGSRFIEVAGKENWSVEDVAEVVGSLLGTKVKAKELPVDAAKPGFVQMGFPEGRAALMAELYQAHARGLLHFAHPHQLTRGTTSLYDALKPYA